MSHLFDQLNAAQKEQQKIVENNLQEVQKKIDVVEEKYYLKEEMPKETFEKFISRLKEEKENLREALSNTAPSSSNLKEYFSSALTFATKLAMVWASSEVKQKENIQKLLFPEGVYYNKENGEFRTKKVNRVFRAIAEVKQRYDDDTNKQGGKIATLS
jgi:site-specific DNA recombinase